MLLLTTVMSAVKSPASVGANSISISPSPVPATSISFFLILKTAWFELLTVALLMPYANVTVFYGHIHQEHHHMTGHIAHHSAKSLIFALPVAGSQPKRTPLAWDAAQPYLGLGFRQVEAETKPTAYVITELPVQKA